MSDPTKPEPAAELVITFKTPLKLADNEYKELRLHEPTARQMEKAAVPDNTVTSNILLIAEVSGLPVEVVRDMSMRELMKATTYLNSFS